MYDLKAILLKDYLENYFLTSAAASTNRRWTVNSNPTVKVAYKKKSCFALHSTLCHIIIKSLSKT